MRIDRKKFGDKIWEILSYISGERGFDKFEMSIKDEKKGVSVAAAATAVPAVCARVKRASIAILTFKEV